jgi:hypothetical protein
MVRQAFNLLATRSGAERLDGFDPCARAAPPPPLQ